jgi:hypothetical protein
VRGEAGKGRARGWARSKHTRSHSKNERRRGFGRIGYLGSSEAAAAAEEDDEEEELQWGECIGEQGDLEMELEGGGGRRRGVVSVVGSVARME